MKEGSAGPILEVVGTSSGEVRLLEPGGSVPPCLPLEEPGVGTPAIIEVGGLVRRLPGDHYLRAAGVRDIVRVAFGFGHVLFARGGSFWMVRLSDGHLVAFKTVLPIAQLFVVEHLRRLVVCTEAEVIAVGPAGIAWQRALDLILSANVVGHSMVVDTLDLGTFTIGIEHGIPMD